MLEQTYKAVNPTLFRNLRKYTSSEVTAINAYGRLFKSTSSWKSWVEDTLGELLEVPSGRKLEIDQSSEFHGEQAQKYVFEQKEISIGRATDNDIPLPLRSISRKHARIVEEGDGFYIEDLQSSSGTYVNRQKLEPAHARRLVEGDEVHILPYVLRVNPQELWARDNEVELVYSCRFSPAVASEFFSKLGSDLCLFQLSIHPEMGQVVLALARPFLKTILSRLTRDNISDLAETDTALLEFVVVSILERANRELQFPFQCLLVPNNRFALKDESGITLEASVRLAQAHGSILLFLPDTCLGKLQTATPAGLPARMKELISWQVMVSIGVVELAVSDLEDLAPGDTLLYSPEVELILPSGVGKHASALGWHAVRDENDLLRFEVKEFFERSVPMEEITNQQNEIETTEDVEEAAGNPTAATEKVELGTLPVRIHVVLSQVELSLKDLEGLSDGSIIQLDEEHRGDVQLVVNGKVLGAGELVEIDDRLGVQITRWRMA